MRVLIVEGDPLTALMMSCWLQVDGFEVAGPFHSVCEAGVTLLSETVDFAFVDIDLEGGVDAAAAFGRRQRCLFVSRSPHVAEIHRGFAAGVMVKPVAVDCLARTVRVLSSGVRPPAMPGVDLFGPVGP